MVFLAAACSDREHDIRANVHIVSTQSGALAVRASDRLAKQGRDAIPTIEAALHTATPQGRLGLVGALGQIGDIECVPLLRHIAFADASEDVRHKAEATLRGWAAEKNGERSQRARKALLWLEEAQGKEGAG
jgi:hypothetical protein